MQPKDIVRDTAKVVKNYLTYQAVKLIIDQLTETNPGEAIWLRQYSSGGKLQDGEKYIEGLMSELQGKKLVMRILTVRDNLAEQVLEYIPEMVSSSIKQANLEHRRRLLERLTQSSPQANNTELDAKESSDENN
ncbi:MAG: chaperonin family protein RbcX [Xenococcaceae cyanobacterium MO_234.B1]|nr:chaperonin family protein RbcX [Xenococcaceae cyanobacterium MO_234.B1]